MDLRTLRRDEGKTLAEVARAVRTDTGNLSRIERGQPPQVDLARRLADYYQVSLDVIYAAVSSEATA